MKLKKIKTVFLIPSIPFDFDSTFYKPDHFTSGDNEWQPGIRWQTWFWKGNKIGLKFINLGIKLKPKLKLEIFGKTNLDKKFINSLIKEIRYRYNLNLNLKIFYF